MAETYTASHNWDISTGEARLVQEELRHKVITEDRIDLKSIHRVAGVDVGFDRKQKLTRAAVAILSYPDLEPVEEHVIEQPTNYPYIPGLLSFREVPAILDVLNAVKTTPDVLLCDSQGLAHPRRFGLACHLGVITDLPAVGVAKSRLVGEHQDVPRTKGSWVPLLDEGELIGCVLRSRTDVKPLYISVGHKVSLSTARQLVMNCLTRYRLPETTRRADKLASNR